MVDEIKGGKAPPSNISQYESDRVDSERNAKTDKLRGEIKALVDVQFTDPEILRSITTDLPSDQVEKLIANARLDNLLKEQKQGLDKIAGSNKSSIPSGAARFGSAADVMPQGTKEVGRDKMREYKSDAAVKTEELIGRKTNDPDTGVVRPLNDPEVLAALKEELPNALYYISDKAAREIIARTRVNNMSDVDPNLNPGDNLARVLGYQSPNPGMAKDYFPETRRVLLGEIEARLEKPKDDEEIPNS